MAHGIFCPLCSGIIHYQLSTKEGWRSALKKISPAQAAALMLCFSLGRLIGFRPEGDSLLICAAAELVSDGLLTAVFVMLPMPGAKHPAFGKVCGAVAGGWLMLSLTLLLAELAESLDYSFPDFYASPAVIAAAAAAAVYCASMGLRGCARAACAVTMLTVLVLLLTAAGAADRFDPERLNLAVTDPGEQFVRQLIRQLSRSAEFPLFILLRERIDRPRRGVLLRSAGQSVISAGSFTLCAGVLGDRGLTGIPADTLSSYSKTSVIERFDALMLLVWTLCLLFSAAALLIGTESCIRTLSSRAPRFTMPVCAGVCALAASLISGDTPSAGAVTAALLAAAMLFSAGAGKRGSGQPLNSNF